MKFRKDFVTNSSSSSYICDICGHDECGYDICLSDAQMIECEEGHIFCEDHLDKTLTYYFYEDCKDQLDSLKDGERQKLLDKYKKDNETDNECIENLKEDEDFLEEYFDKSDIRYYFPKKYCPICNHIVILDKDIVEFAMEHFKVKKDELDEMVRTNLMNK